MPCGAPTRTARLIWTALALSYRHRLSVRHLASYQVPSDCRRPPRSASDQPHVVAFTSMLSRDTIQFLRVWMATHTQKAFCALVQAGGESERPCGVTSPQTHSVLACRRCSRMSEGTMPPRDGPRPSCPITIAPRCGGGSWGCLPRMGLAHRGWVSHGRLHSAYITYIETGIHDGLGTVFGAHGQ